MGLDMYLNKKTYLGWNYEHNRKSALPDLLEFDINAERITYVYEQVGYWRKANAIHNWFVVNIMNNEDKCEEFYVSPDKIRTLLDTCNNVLETAKLEKGLINCGYQYKDGIRTAITEEGLVISNAEEIAELLPTTEGFFFGSTDYDRYYLEDIKYTKELLEEVLKDERGDYYYEASW